MSSLFLQSFVELSILILKLNAKKFSGSISKTLSKIPFASVLFPALYNVKALTINTAVLLGSIANALSFDLKASLYFPRTPRGFAILKPLPPGDHKLFYNIGVTGIGLNDHSAEITHDLKSSKMGLGEQ